MKRRWRPVKNVAHLPTTQFPSHEALEKRRTMIFDASWLLMKHLPTLSASIAWQQAIVNDFYSIDFLPRLKLPRHNSLLKSSGQLDGTPEKFVAHSATDIPSFSHPLAELTCQISRAQLVVASVHTIPLRQRPERQLILDNE
jgi:hypothetical protein